MPKWVIRSTSRPLYLLGRISPHALCSRLNGFQNRFGRCEGKKIFCSFWESNVYSPVFQPWPSHCRSYIRSSSITHMNNCGWDKAGSMIIYGNVHCSSYKAAICQQQQTLQCVGSDTVQSTNIVLSINHTGWILTAILGARNLWVLYFTVTTITKSFNFSFINQVITANRKAIIK
jgi:hypothetical protein